MPLFRWRVVALVLVAASTGCAHGRAPGDPMSSSPLTPRATSTAPVPAPRVPPLSAKARAAGLIDVRTLIPDAIVDLRYATSDNFVGVPMYPPDARCLVNESMAPGLTAAADRLRREHDVVVFWDCYRPHAVQVRMFEIVPDPNWVARPGPFATKPPAQWTSPLPMRQPGGTVQPPSASNTTACWTWAPSSTTSRPARTPSPPTASAGRHDRTERGSAQR